MKVQDIYLEPLEEKLRRNFQGLKMNNVLINNICNDRIEISKCKKFVRNISLIEYFKKNSEKLIE